MVLEPKSLKSGVGRARIPPLALGENPSLPLPVSGGGLAFLARVGSHSEGLGVRTSVFPWGTGQWGTQFNPNITFII